MMKKAKQMIVNTFKWLKLALGRATIIKCKNNILMEFCLEIQKDLFANYLMGRINIMIYRRARTPQKAKHTFLHQKYQDFKNSKKFNDLFNILLSKIHLLTYLKIENIMDFLLNLINHRLKKSTVGLTTT